MQRLIFLATVCELGNDFAAPQRDVVQRDTGASVALIILLSRAFRSGLFRAISTDSFHSRLRSPIGRVAPARMNKGI